MAQTSTPQSFVITTKQKISTLPVKNGQAIFTKVCKKSKTVKKNKRYQTR